ncbi:MAG TPA: efflux RND transporter periplasmic adaptor subunit [Nostocaceae cyanobacterium]|nr:efflux RND transporter periplasmic adaptor subunit [Nostocaceae cyanobacterium]
MTSLESQTDFEENQPQPPSKLPPKFKRWMWLALATILVLGGGVGVAWRLLTAQNPGIAAGGQPPGVKVKIAPVETGTVEESTEFIANLDSRRSVNLQPRVQGQITQIFVNPGDRVSSGTAIMQIDARQQQAAVSSLFAAGQASQAQLENARATLQSLEAERLATLADLRLNEQDYKRYSDLASQGAVSRQTRDTYANRLATARSQLGVINSRIQAQRASIAQAQRTLEQADANIREQQVQLQYYKITAPFSGTIGDIPVKIGDFVNNSSSLATITQNQPLEVRIDVPIERGSELRQGLPVEILNAQGENLGTSEIFFIAPNINNNTQSIQIKALYDNSDGLLRANQFVRAKIIWDQRRGVTVPTTAVARIAGETFVFVAEEQKSPQGEMVLVAKQKRVKLGDIRVNNYQIISGLQTGEKLIISGIQNLRDGIPIMPE